MTTVYNLLPTACMQRSQRWRSKSEFLLLVLALHRQLVRAGTELCRASGSVSSIDGSAQLGTVPGAPSSDVLT
jgi:hypothetical protein